LTAEQRKLAEQWEKEQQAKLNAQKNNEAKVE